MSEKKGMGILKSVKAQDGVLSGLLLNIRLVVRLLKDKRVNPLLKILPIGALIYLLTPIDILSLNPIDDGLVMWLGSYLFIQLCPTDIVDEHRNALLKTGDQPEQTRQGVIDALFRDKDRK